MFEDTNRLVERCIRRDQKAWGEFIERFSGLLYFSARERLKRSGMAFNQQDIEDIVQGVFLEIWEKDRLAEVRERKKLKAWLSIMAQTRALNYLRQKKERILHSEEVYKVSELKADGYGQIDEELMVRLENVIEGLDNKKKLIFKMNIIYGKTHREIAEFMKIPANTVSTIIAREKKRIKEKIKDLG